MSILNNTSPTPLSPSPAFVAELRRFCAEQRTSLKWYADHDPDPDYGEIIGRELILDRLEERLSQLEAPQ